jgi:pimeloyl-ACP methyl ester carboxylesterase
MGDMNVRNTTKRSTAGLLVSLMTGAAMTTPAMAFGEAGPLALAEWGNFTVGGSVSEPDGNNAVTVSGRSYVGYAVPAEQSVSMPLVLIHGGGGQASDWFSTVDGRDGWRNYFLAAGISTYWMDRPGLGRSPSNPTFGPDDAKGIVGQANSNIIGGLASSENWPGANMPEGEWNRDAWIAANPGNEGVLNWLASSSAGPYGGNELARSNIVSLVADIGPVVLFGHSAGVASTLASAISAPAGTVGGVLVFEGGVDLLNEANRALATWEPALPADFTPVEVEGCPMQPEDAVSRNVSMADIPVVIIRSEHGNQSDDAFSCAVRQLEQMGVDAKFVQLADVGFTGGGHFMMSDTNSAEIATDVLIPIVTYLSGDGEFPADWTIAD